MIETLGKRSIKEAAEAAGVSYGVFRARLYRGWTLGQAAGLEPPPPKKEKEKQREAFGESRTLTEWSIITGIPRQTLVDRMHKGASMEQAIQYGKVRPGKRDAVKVVCNGEEVSLSELAKREGLYYQTLKYRIKTMGMAPEEAIARPNRAMLRGLFANGCKYHADCGVYTGLAGDNTGYKQ